MSTEEVNSNISVKVSDMEKMEIDRKQRSKSDTDLSANEEPEETLGTIMNSLSKKRSQSGTSLHNKSLTP